jgi:hypothetical protein
MGSAQPARTDVIAQPHCITNAVMGWSADAAALRRAGVAVNRLGGCCGLAGNWAWKQGHYDVSVAIAEQSSYLPCAESSRETVVLADGIIYLSHPVEQLTGRHGTHLAELLASALPRE